MLKIIRHYFSSIKTDLFHSSVLLSGSVVAQIVSFLAYPVLTRLYNPSQFGDFSVFLSITGILTIISTGRLEYALMIPEKDEEANHLKLISIRWCFVFSVLLFFAAILIGFLQPQLGSKIPAIYSIPLAVFMTGFIQIFTFFRNRLKQYKDLAKISVVQNLTATGSKIFLGFTGLNGFGLIAGSIIGQIAASLLVSWKFISREIFRLPSEYKAILRKYAVFPKYRMVQALINSLSSNLPILFLTYYFSARHAGFYGLILGIAYKITSLVTSAMYPVLFRRFTELRHSQKRILPFFSGNIILLTGLGILPAFLIFVFSKTLVLYFLGQDWIAASDYIRMMLPWLVMTFIMTPFSFMADVFSLQKQVLMIDIIVLLMRIFVLFAGFWLNSAYLSVILYSIVSVFYLLMLMIWYYSVIVKQDKAVI